MNTGSRLPLTVPNSAARMKSISKGLGVLVFGIGCLVLAGWAFDIPALKSVVPGLATMKSMTAMLFVLAGIALLLQAEGKSQQAVRACAFIIALIGSLTLGEYIFNADFGIDQLLFRDTATGSLFPGRMSPATALSFLLVGLALFFGESPQRIRFKDIVVIAVFAISMLALIGYLYGVSSLYQIGAYTSMALHTALCFVVLAVGILLARPERSLMQTVLADTAGGYVLRRFLPIAFGFPIFLGWLRLLGQRAGLYDTAFGLAIMVIALITTLTISIWVNAQQLTQTDLKRKQTYDALSESETRFRTTIESMAEGYQIVGSDWRHLYVNSSAARNTQLSREQMLGRTVMECFPGIENTAMFGTFRECMEARTSRQLQTEYMFPNGTKGWFDINVQAVPDGILILSSDITERKQAETALAQQHNLLRTMVDILPVELYFKDRERRFIVANRLVANALDVADPDDLIGKRDEDFIPVRVAKMFAAEDENIMHTGESLINDEHSPSHKSNPKKWFLRTKIPFKDESGRIIGLIGLGNEITKLKMVEEELLKLNAQLEEKILQRTAELAQANEQLQQLAILDELTGLYNRRGFLLLAEEQFLLAKRSRRNLLVFYADLDHLKQINDRFGHAAGDEAIASAADALTKTFRVSDIKARLGGDEFLVLAIEAEGHDIPTLLARLQEKLAERNQSMSVGAISFDAQHEISMEDLITQADKAMYEVKMRKPGRHTR